MRLTPFVMSCLLAVSSVSVGGESDYNLGVDAYRNKNYSEAASQWKKSVARGDVDAMNNLGFLLYYGYGVTKDLDAAIALWRAASFAGNSEAQWHLGNAYETGVGVQRDPVKAYAWYRCSVESASTKVRSKQSFEVETGILKDSRDSLQQLGEKLSALELANGQALADEYIARYAKHAP
jgi:TPR repeat protein